jgi:hypothetical protein
MSPTAPPQPPPRFLTYAGLLVRSGLRRLADLFVPAELRMFELVGGVGLTAVIGAAAHLRLADQLATGPRTVAELAASSGVPAEHLHRMLRALVSVGVFSYRPADKRFSNNRLSETLVTTRSVSLRDWATYFASPSNVRAWSDFEGTLRTGESAFARIHGMSVWKWLAEHPHESEVFGGAMSALSDLFASGVATSYPFSEVRRLCDVGGGIGTLLAPVLVRNPHLEAVLFDGPGVADSARTFLTQRGVAARVDIQAGNFFDFVPPGCDAYLLKNILHDWDDERVLQILRNCRKVMTPGNRLLVVELVVEAETMHGFGPLSDLQMMVVCDSGRERGRQEFERLYERAGFRLGRVLPTPLFMSVVEGIAV